jgi:radical SAM superfamily enzyme YgiQ (UPF0313 family)
MSTNVLMVFPRFNQNSFWSLKATCRIYGARCVAPPLGLLTVAALLPHTWNIRLVDRNARKLNVADVDWADMVMTGGMRPQRLDAQAVIALGKARGKPVVVGGPDATSSPEAYEDTDFLVLGEAEGIIGTFVAAWQKGERRGRFCAEKFRVDVTKSPIPRFDLLNANDYLYVGVQFSRGCPFNCEFCDIIELYGRVPRAKTNGQVLAELQALYDKGYRGQVDFVDDNLIGNKKALKQLLPALEGWQAERGHPFVFSTEASINLADDPELLDMMAKANFFAVFTGIESPDTATLVAARKKQNTRRSLADGIRKINEAGMIVLAGFIVGFDTEQSGVAKGMIECVEATSIPACMVGLLTALPGTQLYRRLEKEGRLLDFRDETAGDQCTAGLNFLPSRSRRAILEDYRQIVATIYQPETYFDRVLTVARRLRPRPLRSSKRTPMTRRRLVAVLRLMLQMTFRMGTRRHFWRTLVETMRRHPWAAEETLTLMALYLHLGPFAKFVVGELDRQIALQSEGDEARESQVSSGEISDVRRTAVPTENVWPAP